MEKSQQTPTKSICGWNRKPFNMYADKLKKEWLQDFMEYLDVLPKTKESYKGAIIQFYEWLEVNQIQRPTRADILQYRDDLKQNHKNTTVLAYIVALRRYFKWLNQIQLYPNIADDIKGAKVSKNFKKDYLTSDQVKHVLSNLEASESDITAMRNKAMILLMVTCGLRTIEVSRANIEDLQRRGNRTVLYVQGKGKEDKSDFINVPFEVDIEINKYLIYRDASESGPLFISHSNNSIGQRLTTRSIRGIVKEALSNANLTSDRLTAHSLRHTAITLALIGNEPLEAVSQLARHTSINTTMIYNHALDMDNNTCSETVMQMIADEKKDSRNTT